MNLKTIRIGSKSIALEDQETDGVSSLLLDPFYRFGGRIPFRNKKHVTDKTLSTKIKKVLRQIFHTNINFTMEKSFQVK